MHKANAHPIDRALIVSQPAPHVVGKTDTPSFAIEYPARYIDISEKPAHEPAAKRIFRAEEIAFRITPNTPAELRHPAEVARNATKWGIRRFEDKATLTQQAVTYQTHNGTYPYDRYLTNGSNFISKVETPRANDTNDCIVWCTNLYLGLNRNPQIIEAVKAQISTYGTGCGTSAVSGGFSSRHKELEHEIAKWVGKEDAILFSTGFTANLGAISTIATPNDLIIFDKECHSSIIDGIKLSGAHFKTFRNNDAQHLTAILEKVKPNEYDNIFVVTEAVFGMTGEEAPISEYCKLKSQFTFLLYVDEAHSLGIYGKTGSGYCVHTGCSQDVDFIMGTLSKATASVGGFIACRADFAAFLRISSNPYMFQACLPPGDVIAALEAIKIIQQTPSLQDRLWHNTNRFRNGLIQSGFNVGHGTSPVVPLFIEQDDILANVCKFLYSHGVYTNWIAYPAVRKNSGRLRFIVSAGHTEAQIDTTLEVLKKADKEFKII
ncbi:pyridoxal phosphate-dependent aminotransferase family protein [bacterium]|nr:pyridoxal phosphate-dependent aminotransferase family protein [bacterium]